MNTKISRILTAILGILLIHSCSEPYAESVELEKFMYLSLSGSVDEPAISTVNLDETASKTFSFSYGGTTNYEQGEIIAEIDVDNSLVDKFNAENNTSYSPLPAGSYSLDKTSLKIENGSRISDMVTVTVQPNKMNFVNDYLVPVTIKSTSGGTIPLNEELKTAYWVIKGDVELLPLEQNWTVHGTSSVWQEIYDVPNIYDGNRNSYWHSALDGMPQWVAINMNEYKLVEGFTWINRQDQGQYALPKHVKFETSMNGTDWTEVLDIPELPNTRILQILELPQKVIAKYFKVTILSNWANAPYTYFADVSTWAGEKPTGDYDWEKNTWQVVSYRSEWTADWGVSKVIDGDKNSTWHSEPFNAELNGMPQWFIIDMMKNRPAIKGFLIWNRQSDHGMEPKHIVFSISDDGENWTQILELLEMSNDYTKELNYPTTNPTPGRYFKVEVETNWGNGGWTYLGEITPY